MTHKRSFNKRNKFFGKRFFFIGEEFTDKEILVHYTIKPKYRFQNGRAVLRDKNNPFSLIKTKRVYLV